MRAPGVHVLGARIEGPLDLTDFTRMDGGALPSLVPEECDLTGGADLLNAHFTRLSLKDSCIHEVRMRGLRLDGSHDIAGLHGAARTSRLGSTPMARLSKARSAVTARSCAFWLSRGRRRWSPELP